VVVGGNQDHRKNPSRDLEEILVECGWQYVGLGLWEKGRSRLLVDNIGAFLYHFQDGFWHRIHGISHSRINVLPKRVIWFDVNCSLDLITGMSTVLWI
jgi:hypothetical protein